MLEAEVKPSRHQKFAVAHKQFVGKTIAMFVIISGFSMLSPL